MRILQINKGSWSQENSSLKFITVVINFIAPRIDLAPAKCRENIDKSIDGPD